MLIAFMIISAVEFVILCYIAIRFMKKLDHDTELKRYDRWWANEYDSVPTDLNL